MNQRKYVSHRQLLTRGVLALTCVLSSGSTLAIDFDEAEKLDKIEGTELLTKARNAAGSGQFSSARSLIAQALSKGAPQAQVKAAERVLAQAEADDARRKEEARLAEESRKAAQTAAATNAGGNVKGDGATLVFIEGVAVCGIGCSAANLSVSGPGEFDSHFRGSDAGKVSKGISGSLIGNYSYTFTVRNGSQTCSASGRFALDGTKGKVELKHYKDCSLATILSY